MVGGQDRISFAKTQKKRCFFKVYRGRYLFEGEVIVVATMEIAILWWQTLLRWKVRMIA